MPPADREPVTAGRLAAAVGGRLVGNQDQVIADVGSRLRSIRPGDLFVATGSENRLRRVVVDAAERGAVAVCVERELTRVGLTQIVVDDPRSARGNLGSIVHGCPSEHLSVIAVTGTDGKTTVVSMIEAIADAAGRKPATVGTLGVRVDRRPAHRPPGRPDGSDFQRLLRNLLQEGVEVVGVEATAQAVAAGHLNGCRLAATAFTNLSHEHLDVHLTMERYFQAKAGLLRDHPGPKVVCTDGRWGKRLARQLALSTASLTTVSIDGDADVVATDLSATRTGARFLLSIDDQSLPVGLSIPGRFNVANALVAAACCHSIGVEVEHIAAGLNAFAGPPGRFESLLPGGSGQQVFVDYAHTPAAIQCVVAAARGFTSNRVIVVLGAGGDRDRAKRYWMGRAASAADVLVVTSDNPRREDPARIAEALARGAQRGSAIVVVRLDRREAIRHAIGLARPDDVILLLGKGHETTQEVGAVRMPFSDHEVARAELRALGIVGGGVATPARPPVETATIRP